MRSSIAVAAFAVGALAAPYQKRDEVIVTEVDVAYATDVVTVMATALDTVTAAATPDPSANNWGHWGGWGSWGGWSKTTSTTSTTETPPPPAPTTSSTSVYVPPPAPTTTSTTPPPPPPAPETTTSTPPPPPPAPTTTPAPASSWAAPSSAGEVATTTTEQDVISWTSSAAYTGYSDAVVAHHNFHRFNHSSQLLTWNESLAKSAQDIADTCIYAHNMDMDGGGYGQNIAAGIDMNNISMIITDLFYNDEMDNYKNLYNQDQPDMTNFESWGHFSQLVWADTTSVACATSNCTGRGLGPNMNGVAPYFTVCNYFPSGNWAGDYGKNIHSPKSLAVIPWNAA